MSNLKMISGNLKKLGDCEKCMEKSITLMIGQANTRHLPKPSASTNTLDCLENSKEGFPRKSYSQTWCQAELTNTITMTKTYW